LPSRRAGDLPWQGTWRTGNWPAVVDDWLFDAVLAKLSDLRRRKQADADRTHLASGEGSRVRPR
jgi:hypothetical protein